MPYAVPELKAPTPAAAREVLLVASGDLRESANKICWPAQAALEAALTRAFRAEGFALRRAHPYACVRFHRRLSRSCERAPAAHVFPFRRRGAQGHLQTWANRLEPRFVEGGALHADLGKAMVIELPVAETQRRWKLVTSQWPIMHVVLPGISRDQFMARHRANHLNVAYAPAPQVAERALAAKAAMMAELGINVHLCGC